MLIYEHRALSPILDTGEALAQIPLNVTRLRKNNSAPIIERDMACSVATTMEQLASLGFCSSRYAPLSLRARKRIAICHPRVHGQAVSC
jgi:hypothetical protein